MKIRDDFIKNDRKELASNKNIMKKGLRFSFTLNTSIFQEFLKIKKKNIWCGIIIGILIHGFALVNKWPNWDDLGQTWDTMERATSGRWLLTFPASISSSLSMPWVNGILAIFYIVIAANLVIVLLDFKKQTTQLLVEAIMLSFPAIGAGMFYTNSIDGYAFGILLTVLGVFFVLKISSPFIGVIIGSLCIAGGLGCYQAYLAFGAALSVIYLIDFCVYNKKDESIINIMTIIGRLIGTFVLSLILYFILVKFTTIESGLTDYMGINQMGKISIRDIPDQVLKAYQQWIKVFFQDSIRINGRTSILLGGTIIACIFLLIIKIWKRCKTLLQKGMAIFFLIVFPVSCNLVYLMNSNNVHTIMLYGLVSTFILMLLIFERSEIKWIFGIGAVAVFLFAYNYSLKTNMAYFSAHLAYEENYAYAERLLTKVETVEGFSSDEVVYFIGTPEWNYNSMDVEWMGDQMFRTFTGLPLNLMQRSAASFCNKYLGFQQEIVEIKTQEDAGLIENYAMISTMPTYPDEGSILKTSQGIFVKFSEIY